MASCNATSGAVGIAVLVRIGGVEVKVDVGTETVFVGTGFAVWVQEDEIIAKSKTVMKYFIFIDTLLCKEIPNGWRY
jgi:phosphotransferase system IIA component